MEKTACFRNFFEWPRGASGNGSRDGRKDPYKDMEVADRARDAFYLGWQIRRKWPGKRAANDTVGGYLVFRRSHRLPRVDDPRLADAIVQCPLLIVEGRDQVADAHREQIQPARCKVTTRRESRRERPSIGANHFQTA
jgi:hypothetical protein